MKFTFGSYVDLDKEKRNIHLVNNSQQNPDILAKMVAAYGKYSNEIGLIPPEYSEKQLKLDKEVLTSLSNKTTSPQSEIETISLFL